MVQLISVCIYKAWYIWVFVVFKSLVFRPFYGYIEGNLLTFSQLLTEYMNLLASYRASDQCNNYFQ